MHEKNARTLALLIRLCDDLLPGGVPRMRTPCSP